jgi:hypothetical protein
MAFDRGDSQTGVTSLAVLPVEQGGTNASTAAQARTNLGVTATGLDTTYLYRTNNLSDLISPSTARTNLRIMQSFVCERNGVGTINQVMAFGNGAGTGKGIRMPFAGKLIAATLAGVGVNGTVTVDVFRNGSANSSYRLTATNGSAADVGVTQNWSSSPLSFSAGDTIGWQQVAVPSAANTYNVSFYVIFD